MTDLILGLWFGLAWLFGALPLGQWLGRCVRVQSHALAQAGPIAFWRVVGWRRALLILGADFLKGLAVPAIGAFWHRSDWLVCGATALVIVGHCRSPFLRWQVGKGTLVILGALFGLTPLAGLVAFLTWLLVVRLSHSLPSALIGAIVMMLALTPLSEQSLPVTIFVLSAMVVTLIAHQRELRRYFEGRGFQTDLFRADFSAGLNKQPRPGSSIPLYSLGNRGRALGRLLPAEGGAVNWGFIGHLLADRNEMKRFNPSLTSDLGTLPDAKFEKLKRFMRFTVIGEGRIEANGRKSYGTVLALGREPIDFQDPAKRDEIRREIERAIKYLRQAGCTMIGLGGLTSPIVEAGDWLDKKGLGPVTSGNALTAGGLIDAMFAACRWMGTDLQRAKILIIGASGSVGRPVAEYVAQLPFRDVVFAARTTASLQTLKKRLAGKISETIRFTTDGVTELSDADVIISIVTTPIGIADPNLLKPGAIWISGSVPTDFSEALLAARPDVLFLQGGIYQFPGILTCAEAMSAGTGDSLAYACTLETMLRALEGQTTSGGIGLQVTVEEMESMRALARAYGAKLAGFRVLGRRISLLQIILIRWAALMATWRRSALPPTSRLTQPKL